MNNCSRQAATVVENQLGQATLPSQAALPGQADLLPGQDALPAYMLGDFDLETTSGLNDFMYAVGVGWFTRRVGKSPCRTSPPLVRVSCQYEFMC